MGMPSTFYVIASKCKAILESCVSGACPCLTYTKLLRSTRNDNIQLIFYGTYINELVIFLCKIFSFLRGKLSPREDMNIVKNHSRSILAY